MKKRSKKILLEEDEDYEFDEEDDEAYESILMNLWQAKN